MTKQQADEHQISKRTRPFLLIVSALLILIAVGMSVKRQSTYIEATITAEGATFDIGGKSDSTNGDIKVIGHFAAKEITVSEYSAVTFTPSSLEIKNNGWCLLDIKKQPIKFDVSDKARYERWPSIKLESYQDRSAIQNLLGMKGISVQQNSTVALRAMKRAKTISLNVSVKGQKLSTDISASKQFQLTTTNSPITGISMGKCRSNELQNEYRVNFANGVGTISIEGQPNSVQYVLTPGEDNNSIFPRGKIPITSINFNDKTGGGIGKSMIINGTIDYPKHNKETVKSESLKNAEILMLEGLTNVQIDEITRNEQNNFITFKFHGTFENARKISDLAGDDKDLRLTIMQNIKENSIFAYYAIIFITLITTLYSVYKFFLKSQSTPATE